MRWLFVFLFSPVVFAQLGPIQLRVDATAAPQRIIHAHLTMPAQPGPLTLVYPKWIPGEHMATGPIINLVGLKIMAAGQPVAWQRDSVNMYAFHLTVPAGATALDVDFDYLPPSGGPNFSSGSSTTSELAVLNWNQMILYPEGSDPAKLQFQATLQVPKGWRYGTALPIRRESGDVIEFQPADATTLVDSPVSTGRYYRTIDLGADRGAQHYVHLAADSPGALEMSAETIQQYKNVVAETGALFGSRHYRDYHFLYTLSDHVKSFGLEHHESSDDRALERSAIDPAFLKASAYLLPHEMVHSWNGKFRRPEGLATGGYDLPMKGDLLWVYEGLTNYLGEVLAARSGLWTQDEYRQWLAITAAALQAQAGRKWRPLEDTAVAAQLLYSADDEYSEYRRGTDFYPEGTLLWLEADVTIRKLSNGSKSLNDFCRTFHGGPGGAPALKPYSFSDIVAALNSVQPYDWEKFWIDRVRTVTPRAPLNGITSSGWKLVFRKERSSIQKAREERDKEMDLMYSLGMRLKEDGNIIDVAFEGPAKKAGVPPATQVIAVNGRQYTPLVLREGVSRGEPVELLIRDGEYYRSYRIEYTSGERYPQLERDPSIPDLLSLVTSPLASKASPRPAN
jgi:predicted metalloprotease with PDZ domain